MTGRTDATPAGAAGVFADGSSAPAGGHHGDAHAAGVKAAVSAGKHGAGSPLGGTWLALDTSTASMTVALAKEGRVTAERDSTSERNHSIRLLPEVESLLAEANLEPGELAAIAVGRGPGSYTGIRIGVTVAKMMAWSLNLPLYAVSSLEALAYGAVLRGKTGDPEDGTVWIVPLMDARRGKAYTGLYAFGPEGWQCLGEDGIRPMEAWLDQLAERFRTAGELSGEASIIPSDTGRSGDVVRILFAGDHAGFQDLLDGFASRVPAAVVTDDEPLSASAVIALAWMHGERCRVDDPHNLLPNYTQLSEPEKKLAAKHAALKP